MPYIMYLQEYAAALRLVVPPRYVTTSHHHMLAEAFTASMELPEPQQVSITLVKGVLGQQPAAGHVNTT